MFLVCVSDLKKKFYNMLYIQTVKKVSIRGDQYKFIVPWIGFPPSSVGAFHLRVTEDLSYLVISRSRGSLGASVHSDIAVFNERNDERIDKTGYAACSAAHKIYPLQVFEFDL